MVAVYDSWERLVRATLRREQLRLIAERTPSDRSLASSSSSSSSSFNFNLHSSRLSPRKFPSLLFGMKFGYDEILRAANYFSESKLIKRGRSGDLFRGVIRGTLVVIKRIDWSSAEKESYCISELKVLAKLPFYGGLVPLLGYCLDNWNEKYLVYVCLPMRDLSSSFYSKLVWLEHVYPPWWNWRNRLRIAIGLAEVLSYLHQCVPPLVHRDIQASSILLDDDFKVRLCSLGDVCTAERKSITKFLGLPQDFSQGPSGTGNATRSYDVYCFGKVLLDLGTGKLGAAADSTIMEDLMNENPHKSQEEEDHVARMKDPVVIMDMPELKEEVQAMVPIAKTCLNPEPSKRPSIANVLMALKDLSKVVPADPPGLNGAALRKTLPKRSKISRLVLGTWLRS